MKEIFWALLAATVIHMSLKTGLPPVEPEVSAVMVAKPIEKWLGRCSLVGLPVSSRGVFSAKVGTVVRDNVSLTIGMKRERGFVPPGPPTTDPAVVSSEAWG